jgi:curli biogenesis system outer membrane secretion channel CsgG
VVVVAVVALVATGCGAGASTSSTTTSGASSTATTRAPLPAGQKPSEIAKQVCQEEARQDIASALGETATVSEPTWVDHLYSCRYSYPTGSMVLSVKELSSWTETDAYFQMLADQLGKTRELENLGQGAFQTTDGSVVVRKDWKVLTVDISSLPAQFGIPATSSGDVAVTVGDVILGCWAGD